MSVSLRRGSFAPDRRSGKDRRKNDRGLPRGIAERRRAIEPRKPEVVELDLTESQWATFGEHTIGSKATETRSSRDLPGRAQTSWDSSWR